jgi:ATP adenylyltransferase
MSGPILLAPGTLAAATRERTRSALASGALLPIATRQCRHDDGAMRFVVRTMSSLARRAESRSAAAAAPGPRANPFLPYEDALLVAAITPTHLALLNKFPVQDEHLLIVTRAFAPQEALLDADDFLALAACLADIDGLAFYNGGEVAGASQAHKHLQLVPLPLADGIAGVPIEVALEPIRARSFVAQVPGLPFRCAYARLDPAVSRDPPVAARELDRCYHALLAAAGVGARTIGGVACQDTPYNLLVTRRWLLVVPRSRECFGSISLNALAFGGALFVRDEADLRVLLAAGPMTALGEVGVPVTATANPPR